MCVCTKLKGVGKCYILYQMYYTLFVLVFFNLFLFICVVLKKITVKWCVNECSRTFYTKNIYQTRIKSKYLVRKNTKVMNAGYTHIFNWIQCKFTGFSCDKRCKCAKNNIENTFSIRCYNLNMYIEDVLISLLANI